MRGVAFGEEDEEGKGVDDGIHLEMNDDAEEESTQKEEMRLIECVENEHHKETNQGF